MSGQRSAVESDPREKSSRPLVVLLLVIIVALITAVTVQTALTPAPGAAGRAELRDGVRAALQADDESGFKRLFDDDTAGDDYAADYLRSWQQRGADRVVVDTAGDALVARGYRGGHQTACSAWPVFEDGSRWLLKGTPATDPGLCR